MIIINYDKIKLKKLTTIQKQPQRTKQHGKKSIKIMIIIMHVQSEIRYNYVDNKIKLSMKPSKNKNTNKNNKLIYNVCISRLYSICR